MCRGRCKISSLCLAYHSLQCMVLCRLHSLLCLVLCCCKRYPLHDMIAHCLCLGCSCDVHVLHAVVVTSFVVLHVAVVLQVLRGLPFSSCGFGLKCSRALKLSTCISVGAPMSADMLSKKDRLVPDHNITVCQIMNCLEKEIEYRRTRDIVKLFEDLATSTTWKTSPKNSIPAIVKMRVYFAEARCGTNIGRDHAAKTVHKTNIAVQNHKPKVAHAQAIENTRCQCRCIRVSIFI